MLLFCNSIMAEDSCDTSPTPTDSVSHKKKNFIFNAAEKVLTFFSPELDTSYVEPQQYSFTAMVQNTNKFDSYNLSSGDDYSIRIAPESRISFGPYFGWKWIFLGYTFDIGILDVLNGNTDIDFNLNTAAVGINLLYRRMNGYKFKSVTVKNKDYSNLYEGEMFPGFNISMTGLNVYYVLNSKKYSQQAIFNQTNRQLLNAGSWIVGCGYNHHEVTTDWNGFHDNFTQKTGIDFGNETNTFDKIDYTTVSVSGGYGYNWVFAKNWAAGGQAMASLSYIWTDNEATKKSNHQQNMDIKDFFTRNFTIDTSLKAGVVWNNSKWFAGANVLLSNYNYQNNNISANNIFGTVNFYLGYNFSKIK